MIGWFLARSYIVTAQFKIIVPCLHFVAQLPGKSYAAVSKAPDLVGNFPADENEGIVFHQWFDYTLNVTVNIKQKRNDNKLDPSVKHAFSMYYFWG